jgi:predicted lipase
MVQYPRCKGCWIHAGFYFDFSVLSLKMYENIDKLLAKYEVRKFVATGHSLGGALALIAGTEVKMNYGNKFEIEVHTFGQPRVGEVNLAQFMKSKIDTIFRVVHNRDIVPHVPFEWLKYAHVPTEVFFSEDMKTFKVCNESG